MGRKSQTMSECDKAASSVTPQFIAERAVAGPHQSRSSNSFVRSRFAVRKSQGMTQFVSNPANENRVVFSETDPSILPVKDDGARETQVL